LGTLIDIVLVLLFIVLPIAALATRSIPLRLTDVTFRDTDRQHAFFLVAQFAEGTFEQRFGYPSGYFILDEKRTDAPRRILAVEAQPSGTVTDGCALEAGSMGLSGFEEGIGAGCLMAFVVYIVASPFILISAADRFFRFVLRSRVDAEFEQRGPDTVATISFYGPSGYSLRKRYEAALSEPVLPADFATLVSPAPSEAHPQGEPSSTPTPPLAPSSGEPAPA